MVFQSALIVDDSKLARITLKKKLETYGLQVELAESGAEALGLLAQSVPGIIFMDHLMPEMDGFAVTQQIRSDGRYAAVPIIMCTGKEHDGYLDEALAIGANQILSKPPSDEALDSILQTDFALSAVLELEVADTAVVVDDVADIDLEDFDFSTDLSAEFSLESDDDIRVDPIFQTSEFEADFSDDISINFDGFDEEDVSAEEDKTFSVVQPLEGDLSDLGSNVFDGPITADEVPIIDAPAFSDIAEQQLQEDVVVSTDADADAASASQGLGDEQLQAWVEEAVAKAVAPLQLAQAQQASSIEDASEVSKRVFMDEKVNLIADVIASLPMSPATESAKAPELDYQRIEAKLAALVQETLETELAAIKESIKLELLAQLPQPAATDDTLDLDTLRAAVQAELALSYSSTPVVSPGSVERFQQLETFVAQQLAANKAATEGLINEAIAEIDALSSKDIKEFNVAEEIELLHLQQHRLFRQASLPKNLSSTALVLGLCALALSVYTYIQ